MRILVLGLALVGLQVADAVAADFEGTLQRIEERGQIHLGFRESEPPMSFRDKAGEAVGYSIDLCGHVVAAVKQTLGRDDIAVSYVPVTAENRFDTLVAGEIDLLCGATTKTLGRSERVGFTQLTFATGATLLSMQEAPIRNLLDLKGKKVAVTVNTTTIEALTRSLEDLLIDGEVVPVASAPEGMDLLDKGEVDAFSSDQVVLIGQIIGRESGKNYYLAEELFSFEPFALAIPRGDPDFQLVADSALSQLNRTGQILRVYEKWFASFAKDPPTILKALYQLNSTPQ